MNEKEKIKFPEKVCVCVYGGRGGSVSRNAFSIKESDLSVTYYSYFSGSKYTFVDKSNHRKNLASADEVK